MRAGPSEQRERSTPTARNARRGARQITTLILTAALIIEPIYGAVRRPGPDAGWTGETGRRLHAVQAERKPTALCHIPASEPTEGEPPGDKHRMCASPGRGSGTRLQSAITGEWADALGLDADVLSAMFGKGSLKSKLTGIVEGRAYNAIGAAIQAATGIPASIFTSSLRSHMANAQKVRTRSNASKIKIEDVATLGMTYAWRNAQYHQAGQVALQVVETAAAVVLNTVGNLFAGAGSMIMAGYYATKQAYLGSLTGGTKGALAGLASGVVSGALTYAVGAYGGGLLGEAAQSIGINVNAGYTFEGGWTGGAGFNFAGLGGQGLGFGANIQLAEGGRQTGGGVDLSFGRGGGRSSVSFSNDGTARLGYTTAGSGPQNNLRGNFGVTLDKDGIAGVDARLTGLNGEASGIEHGVGFILFIKDGRIDCLEGFTYGETWPDDMVLNKVYLDSGREK